jgi:hypothetical protein
MMEKQIERREQKTLPITLEAPYTTTKRTISAEDMQYFEIVNPRQIRKRQVLSVLRALNRGEHFDTEFVVNICDNTKKIRIIDGNHRVQAMIQYFETHPLNKIVVNMDCYRNLSPDEEHYVFRKRNRPVKQTVEDYINSYKETLPQIRLMMDQMPLAIYPSFNKLRLSEVLDAYFASRMEPFSGAATQSEPEEWIRAIKDLNETKIDDMQDTFDLLFEIFNPEKCTDFTRLPAFKTSTFRALFRLIDVNKVLLGKNYVAKRMTTVLLHSVELGRHGGHGKQTSLEAFGRFQDLLNRGTTKKFK